MPNSAEFLAALSKSTTRDTGVYNCIQREFRASIDQQSLQYPMLGSGLSILQKGIQAPYSYFHLLTFWSQ